MRGIRLPHLIILISMLCFTASMEAEIRAIWAMPWSINTRGGIDSLITAAVTSRQTDILVEVRYRADALYQANRRPDDFPNPEPRSYILKNSGLDPLEYALNEGHKNNLRVHAWFVAFNATPVDSSFIANNHIYQNHPDWITYAKNGEQQKPGTLSGCFIDPALPEVQDHLLNVIGDLLSGYPRLDGLHLDYLRYPGSNWGHHPLSIAAFDEANRSRKIGWNQWRIEQVSSFLGKTRQIVESVSPGLILSAAVIPDPQKARDVYAQDWISWLREDMIDYAYPMVYESDNGDFGRKISKLPSDLKQRMIMGIRAWNDNGDSLFNPEQQSQYGIMDVAEKITAVRQAAFAGVSLFSYDSLKKDGALSSLAEISFSKRAIAEMRFGEYEHANGIDYAADLNTAKAGRRFEIELRLPAEGQWIWEIRDLRDQILYRREVFYLKGINYDDWNGVLPDGTIIPAGWYLASVFRENDNFKYVMPVTLPELDL